MALSWSDFITPSTLQLAPLIELLIEPVALGPLQTRLRLGLQEALVNAVSHGNGGDPAKLLRIRRIETPRWWIWQVQDQGPGLAPQGRLGKLPAQLDSPKGRGLYLIYQCFDDVRWSPRGNRLQLAASRQHHRDLFSDGDHFSAGDLISTCQGDAEELELKQEGVADRQNPRQLTSP
jgi:serine/threonine-protein kinase RsbW/non-specific serine/threonine protein kinase